MNDESGVMIEGFERVADDQAALAPALLPAAAPRSAGLGKAMDLLMWELEIADREKILPVIFKLAERGRAAPRDPAAQDVAPRAAQGHGPLRRGLQRGLERELGLLPVLQEGPRRLRAGAAARLRRATGSWSPRPPRARPSAVAITVPDVNQVLAKMNGPPAAAGLVALPAQGPDDRPRARRLPRRQARVPAHRRGGEVLRRALRHGRVDAPDLGRDGLDPRDQHEHEPGDGGDGRPDRPALPGLRART